MMATTRITVPLSSAELHALIDAAQRDYRHPRDQARALLRDALGLANPPTANATNPAGELYQGKPTGFATPNL